MIPKNYKFWIAFFLTILVGVASWFTGPDISLKLYYLLLIGAITWYSGRIAGTVIAAAAMAMWFVNLYVWYDYSPWLNVWAGFERIVLFAAAIFALDYVHRQYSARLLHAEERYTKIVESAIEGIIAVDSNNVVRFMNSRAAHLLGYPIEEVTGATLLKLARDEASRILLERMASEPESGLCPCEVQLTKTDGSPLWLLVSAASSGDIESGTRETVLLLTDISERKKSEEELQHRYEQISAMQRLSFGLAQSLHLDQRLQNALRVVVQVTRFDGGLIYLVDEERSDLVVQFTEGLSHEFIEQVKRWEIGKGNTGISARTGKAIFIDDAEHDPVFDQKLRAVEQIHGFATIPLFSKDRVPGVLCIIHRTPFAFSEEMKTMLEAFGKQIGFAIENAKLFEAARARERDLREMSLAMVRLQEDERKRFAREIHDGLSQVLTVLKINTELALKNHSPDTQQVDTYLNEVLLLANEAEIEAKRLANDLRPAILDDFGLKAAIKLHATNFERRTGITIDLHLPFYEIRFDPIIETSVYRIVQELLANVARHAQATKVTIQFLVREGILALFVSDNGKGFDVEKGEEHTKVLHHGLRNMRERVEFIGGTFRVESVKNHGTETLMEIPIREQEYDSNRKTIMSLE